MRITAAETPDFLTDEETLIRLEDVHFAYVPERPVLAGVSLELRPGERLALTGANGSGKSTLLHLIVGLLRPGAGTVHAFGSMRGAPEDFHEVRRKAGLLFQDADDQLFCPTVLEDAAFGPLNLGRTQAEARAIAAAALERVGLADFGDRITHRLSGGEKRLAALAGVLAMEPRVLLLDEPAAGLDEAAAERVLGLLAGLDLEMIIVSHDREFMARLATREMRLSGGKIAEAD